MGWSWEKPLGLSDGLQGRGKAKEGISRRCLKGVKNHLNPRGVGATRGRAVTTMIAQVNDNKSSQ